VESLYFEDFRVGDCVVSPGRTITETDLVLFASLTGDWHPLHTNVEYAKDSPFGERIAHGLLILAVSTGLMFRTSKYTTLPETTIALGGIEKVRFVASTKIGDTIHLESEVIRATAVDHARGLITMSQRVGNQRGEKVLTFDLKVLVARRPQEEPSHG
jgi:3-hydroxybutyryl-CoA dehydratase